MSRTGVGLGLLLGWLSHSATAAPRRIAIRHGHGTAWVHGYLHGFHSRAEWVFHGRKGQHVLVQTTQGGATVVMVRFPNGESSGAPGGTEEVLPQTGDCHITVTEHHMAEPWHGRFTLKVTLR